MEELRATVATKVAEVFGAEARVTGLAALAGDASSRRYFRAAIEAPGGPRTAIVMSWSDSGLPISSEELAVFEEPPRELPFLNVHRFLRAAGVRVPAVHGHWVEEGLLLLEDLGDVCLWDRVQDAPEAAVVRWYEKAIDELLVLQVGGTRARNDQCMAFRTSLRPAAVSLGVRSLHRVRPGGGRQGKPAGGGKAGAGRGLRARRRASRRPPASAQSSGLP